MKVLIDTHIALWVMLDDPRLPQKAKDIVLDCNNDIYYSVASIWEVTIKHVAHPDSFLYDGGYLAKSCDDNGFIALPIKLEHVYALTTLKRPESAPRHKDPFDKLLLAQAKADNIMFLTHDSLIPDYNESCVISV